MQYVWKKHNTPSSHTNYSATCMPADCLRSCNPIFIIICFLSEYDLIICTSEPKQYFIYS